MSNRECANCMGHILEHKEVIYNRILQKLLSANYWQLISIADILEVPIYKEGKKS